MSYQYRKAERKEVNMKVLIAAHSLLTRMHGYV